MKIEELKNNQVVKEWFIIANLKETTEIAYLQGLIDFISYTGKDPEAILREAEEDTKKPLRERRLKLQLSGFRKWLQDQGKAPHTVKGRVTAMKSFFATFDIEVPKLQRIGKAKTLIENEDIPKKDDLQAALKVCDPLERAVILIGVSSGLAAAEICNLKVSDFKTGKDEVTGITTLKLRREKVGFNFVTFLTPEATQAVQDYLNYRERIHDTKTKNTINHLEKQRIHSDSDALFIIRNVPEAYLKNYDDNLRKYDTPTLMKLYRRLSNQSGQSTPIGNWNLIRSHNLRKFYNSAMLNAGCDSFFVEFTMGHTLDDTRAAYFRASPDKLKELYMKYVPYLTIQKDLDISESPEFHRLKEENAILAAEAVKATVERQELQQLRGEVDRLNQLTQVTIKSIVDGRQLTVNEYMQEIEDIKKQAREKHGNL